MPNSVIDPQSLPTSMRAAIAIRNAAQNTSANEKVIDDLVASEPVVAASMLHFANSAAYRRRGTISSIRDATKLLGFATVREIAAHVAVMQLVNGMRSSVVRATAEALFRHCLTVSCVAQYLATDLGHVEPGRVGALGLFHELPLFCWLLQQDRAHGNTRSAAELREAAGSARLLGIESIMRDLGLEEFAIPSVADRSVIEMAHGTSWDPNPLIDFRSEALPAPRLDESQLGTVRRRIDALHGLIDLSQVRDATYPEPGAEPPAAPRPMVRPVERRTLAESPVFWLGVVALGLAVGVAALIVLS